MAGSFAKQSDLLMINVFNIVGILVDTVKCSTFTVVPGEVMATVKTATLTFRIDPGLKEALRIAADQEHRSIANMVEVLIRGYCERHGIAIPHSEETKNNNGVRP
ncbi:hypothetical protein [Pseudothauera rhizosphaerae]|nr:hypothetical protein [Pseudothauera rhizosphaerae]